MLTFKKLLFTLMCVFTSVVVEAKIYPFSQNNQLTLMEDPVAASETKLQMVREAKHHIHIITYFWDDSTFPRKLAKELVKANERGVEVRILTTFFPSLLTDMSGRSKKWLSTKNSKALFNYLRMKPVEGLTLSNNLHEKIFLVDGERAVIGGRNISDSSFRGKDMEVMLEGPVVHQVQEHFRVMHDFMLQLETNSKCNANVESCLLAIQELEQTRFYENDPDYFVPSKIFEPGIVARIITHEAILKQHQNVFNIKERVSMDDDIMKVIMDIDFKKLRAYHYFIIPTPIYKKHIEKMLEEGKEIQLITNSQKSASFVSNKGYLYSLPDMNELAGKGLEMFQWKGDGQLAYLHEKVMIFDEDHAIIGSHNFGIGSTSVSNEIAVEFKSKEIAGRLIEVFDEEISNIKLTKKVKQKSLLNEINEHFKWIKVLRADIIADIVRELY